MHWPPCEKDNEAVCNRNFGFIFKADNAKKKQLQRAPITLDSVDTYISCLDCSEVFKAFNRRVGT
jgi:hypothetical protein